MFPASFVELATVVVDEHDRPRDRRPSVKSPRFHVHGRCFGVRVVAAEPDERTVECREPVWCSGRARTGEHCRCRADVLFRGPVRVCFVECCDRAVRLDENHGRSWADGRLRFAHGPDCSRPGGQLTTPVTVKRSISSENDRVDTAASIASGVPSVYAIPETVTVSLFRP